MRRLVIILVILIIVVIVRAEQCGSMKKCPDCKGEPTEKDCPSGCLTKDRCNCCYVCAKAKGERCEGIYGKYGYCADGLYCDKPNIVEPGTCKEKTTTTKPAVRKIQCKPACSRANCAGYQKYKICSAIGLMKNTTSTDGCQHTTCGSCFFVLDPVKPCVRCGNQSQFKSANGYNKCQKDYSNCLRKHYKTSPIQVLTKNTNSTASGFTFCKES